MTIKSEGIFNQNITIAYNSLDLASIDTGKLKNLITGPIKPALMETPEVIVLLFPLEQIVVQVADKRVRITLQGLENNNSNMLPEIVSKCQKIISSKSFKPIGLGFNYDVVISITGTNALDLLNNLFIADIQKINRKLDAKLSFVTPRLIFQRGDIRYDLILEITDGGGIMAHLNVHFELIEKPFPTIREIRTNFIRERDGANKLVLNLLNEEKS